MKKSTVIKLKISCLIFFIAHLSLTVYLISYSLTSGSLNGFLDFLGNIIIFPVITLYVNSGGYFFADIAVISALNSIIWTILIYIIGLKVVNRKS